MLYLYVITSPSARRIILADWRIFFYEKNTVVQLGWQIKNEVLVWTD